MGASTDTIITIWLTIRIGFSFDSSISDDFAEVEHLYEPLQKACPDWEERMENGEDLYDLAAEVSNVSCFSPSNFLIIFLQLQLDLGRNAARSDDARQLKLNIVDWLQTIAQAKRDARDELELKTGVVLDDDAKMVRAVRDKAESFERVSRKSKVWRGLNHPITGQYILPLNVSYYSDA
jgi:hypothetical protein